MANTLGISIIVDIPYVKWELVFIIFIQMAAISISGLGQIWAITTAIPFPYVSKVYNSS